MRGLLPLPVLRLHVSCDHLWRVAGGGHRGTHRKSTRVTLRVLSFELQTVCLYFYHLLQSAIESLFGASMTGVAYSLFAGQPLTILGSTGPVLVFEKILFKFCK